MREYSAKYFEKTELIINKFRPESIVTIQFFQRNDNVILCGMNEVLDILKKNTNISEYNIKYVPEGTKINALDVVLELEGNYKHFGFLEGIIDGVLVRQSSLATNAHNIKKAANNKEVIFMGDRADHYINQVNDGYAVSIGGIKKMVTDANVKRTSNAIALGTMPHALIQMFDGNLISALNAYNITFPNDNLVALVDFNNNVVHDSLEALKTFGKKLFAIRVDTSSSLVDKMFKYNKFQKGVTVTMIKKLRKALNQNNGDHVKIIVSSGFDEKKILKFENNNAPVDIYGVGGAILKVNLNFTADAVKLNNVEIAKVGRKYREIKNFKILK